MPKTAKVVQFQLVGIVLVLDENGDAADTKQAQVIAHAAEFDQPLRAWAKALERKANQELQVQARQEESAAAATAAPAAATAAPAAADDRKPGPGMPPNPRTVGPRKKVDDDDSAPWDEA